MLEIGGLLHGSAVIYSSVVHSCIFFPKFYLKTLQVSYTQENMVPSTGHVFYQRDIVNINTFSVQLEESIFQSNRVVEIGHKLSQN